MRKNRVEVEEIGELAIEARNDAGEEVDAAALEEGGVAFDPTRMHLDLTKDEKRRTTALLLAIQAYQNLIIKDAEYLREAHAQARTNGIVIQPATMDAMVTAAIQFDAFISGRLIARSGVSRDSQSAIPGSSSAAPEGDATGARRE
jgi:hypothetical protein